MIRILIFITVIFLVTTVAAPAQTRGPSAPSKPFIVKTGQEIADIYRAAAKQTGNKQIDIAPAAGTQVRVAVFHDEKREDDLFEVHDNSDDIYFVLAGKATLMLGGRLVNANEISPGEWRSKTGSGAQRIDVKKGDLVVVPRGTPHQRTVTGKGFAMVLIKVFAENVRPE